MLGKLKVYWRLGIINIFRVLVYRIYLKAGLIKKATKIESPVTGIFFAQSETEIDSSLNSLDLKIFGWIEYSKETIPEWNRSCISNKRIENTTGHWSSISDFDLAIGDIKTVWDLSRFDWLLYFTIGLLKTGDDAYLKSINMWLEDWSHHNPVNQGVNWKCGQEASIRVMHLSLTSVLLKQHKKLTCASKRMLEQHLLRIAPTISYALAQDNNHGISEAVALYIGGMLLESNSSSPLATKWKNLGCYWIENRVKRLIAKDGSFSQHSVNYHRLMLDSLCMAEYFRLQFSQKQFGPSIMSRIRLAIDWLNTFTDKESGSVPNLGANDGANIIPLSCSAYTDFRPTVQLASALFYGKKCYSGEEVYNQPLNLLSIKASEPNTTKSSNRDFSEGGYVYMEKNSVRLFMRYPKYRFRPSQCDALHLDFWINGKNVFRDAGSYSYNTDQQWLDYFSNTCAHNTVQIDSNEQMPRLSRFLFGDWLKVKKCTGLYEKDSASCFSAGYQGVKETAHYREICLSECELKVVDDIRGVKNTAVIRWRLAPGDYEIVNHSIHAQEFEMKVSANVKIERFELVQGWESRFYMKKTQLPVLEIEVAQNAKVVTKVKWLAV